MKFTTQLLTALVAYSAMVAAVPYDGSLALDEECSKYIESNKECLLSGVYADMKIYENYCTSMESDKCKKFYNTSIVDVPECKANSQIYLRQADIYLKLGYTETKYSCLKDENGEFCPLTPIGLHKKYNYHVITFEEKPDQRIEAYNKAMNDTCASKICTDGYLALMDALNDDHKSFFEEASKDKNYTETNKEFFKQLLKVEKEEFNNDQPKDKIVAHLKSEKCTAEAAKSADASSDASQANYLSALFVTLALLLSTFF